MKNIKNYDAEKYITNVLGKAKYVKVDNGIYETGSGKNKLFVTSLSFEQELIYGEGEVADEISQYPLEDILDKYLCHISDFYENLNDDKSKTCYLEFAADDIVRIKNLRRIIGKHVFNKEIKKGDDIFVELIIE